MSMPYGKKSHVGAWQRLAPEAVPMRLITNPLAHAQDMAAQAQTRYQAELDAMFRGMTTSWEVLCARVRWCVAESKLVDLKSHEVKVMEMSPERRKGGR